MAKIECEPISPLVVRIKIFRKEFPKQRFYSLITKSKRSKWFIKRSAKRFKIFQDNSEVTQFRDVQFSFPRWLEDFRGFFEETKRMKMRRRWISIEHLVGRRSKIFGLGGKTKGLEKGGSIWEMWNTDPGGLYRQDQDPLYCSFPFYLAISDENCLAMHIDHPEYLVLDVKYRLGSDRIGFAVNQSYLCFYLFAAENVKEILDEYARLTGKSLFPPRWSLGYHQSRYGYPSNRREALELAKKFREKSIPCDALHLDIQHMDGCKSFTWNEKFGDQEKFVEDVHDLGFKLVTIVDPGVKVENGYGLYESGRERDVFLRDGKGNYFIGGLWPGLCCFPDFLDKNTRRWWAEQHRGLLGKGVDGIWNDMNEPTIFYGKEEIKRTAKKILQGVKENEDIKESMWEIRAIPSRTPFRIFHKDEEGNKISHGKIHNIYGLMEAKATKKAFELFKPNKRPFILTRSGFLGIQRYAVIWTGDNCSSWNHLKLSIPMCLNLGLSGVPFVGVDVGGFCGNCEPELLVRWIQLGAFLPFFRNHSSIKTAHQEPWAFGEPYESANREAIELRYRLLPYIYTLFHKAHRNGIPPMRPLFMEFSEDEDSYSIEDEFMFGPALLISPVLVKGQRKKMVYLPFKEGKAIKWEDWWTGKILESGYHLIDVELEKIPIFIRENKGVPIIRAIQNTEQFPEKLKLRCNLKSKVKIPIYWDDGESFGYKEGNYFFGNFKVNRKGKKVEVSCYVEKDGFKPFWKKVQLDVQTEGVDAKEVNFV